MELPLIRPSIVFVHGLFGHPFKTWGAAKSRWRWRSTSKSRSSKVEVSAADHQFEYESKIGEARFWPQQLLPKVIPSTRIFTWGYDADIDGFLASASQNTVHQHAGNLLSDLSDLRTTPEEVCDNLSDWFPAG